MKIEKTQRKNVKMRILLQGASGSGKTYSSLLLAKGLVGDLERVGVIDTENGSSNLYSDLGNYFIAKNNIWSPEEYIKAIEMFENEKMECIIIDSLSHGWEFLLNIHSSMLGNSFTNWSKITPRHNALIQKIQSSSCHIISTLRIKQGYLLIDKGNGKLVPEKIGLKPIQREGIEYEFTLGFSLNSKNKATCTKDRTRLFNQSEEFLISMESGIKIRNWCNNFSIPIKHNIEDSRLQNKETISENIGSLNNLLTNKIKSNGTVIS